MNTMTESSTPTPAQPQSPWSALGYQQVPGLANRLISRWLRHHRKEMRRFFHSRPEFAEFAERMDNIRKSRQGMLAKNKMFQKVLDDYAKSVTPAGAPESAAAEATPDVAPGDGGPVAALDVQPAAQEQPVPSGLGPDAEGSVRPVEDQGDGAGVVIEE